MYHLDHLYIRSLPQYGASMEHAVACACAWSGMDRQQGVAWGMTKTRMMVYRDERQAKGTVRTEAQRTHMSTDGDATWFGA